MKIKDVIGNHQLYDWDALSIQEFIKRLQEYPLDAVMDVDGYTFQVYVIRDETEQEMQIRLDNEKAHQRRKREWDHQEYLRLKAMFEGNQND